jgi:hypothetical protein
MFASSELENYPSVQETVIKLGPDAPTLISTMGTSIFTTAAAPFSGILRSFEHFADFCEHLMTLPQVHVFFRKVAEKKYGAVLLDAFMCECLLPMAHLANAPIVLVAPSHLMPWNYAAINAKLSYAQAKTLKTL